MSTESKLEGQIRRWNKFFTLFGLRPANLEDENLCVIVREPIAITIIVCLLIIIHFSKPDVATLILDEDGIVRHVHMFGNLIIILQVSLTLRKIEQCSKIQRKFQQFEKYGAFDIVEMFKCYFLFPFLNLAFFAGMDIAEYVFLQPEVNSIDVIPIFSGHLLILYDILHVLHFSVHLSWLKKLIIFLNRELHRVATRLSRKLRNVSCALKISAFHQLEESDEEQTSEIFDILREIKLCRYFYNESFELSKDINKAYATRNLIIISFNVLVGIVFLAPAVGDIITVLTSKIDPDVTNEGITAQHIIFHCKWSVTCFFTVYGMIWACRLTSSEICSTTSLVYDMLALRLDRKVKAERFAVQILHSKIEFSAHEFFRLDNKLFLSITGTFVSYLVVMFQFNI